MQNDYQSLQEYILKGHSKIERKVGHNTIARIDNDKIIVKYHETDVAELYSDRVILHDGGYKTSTTKERLNWYIPNPFRVYQERGNWYLWNYQTQDKWLYQDGITVFVSGKVENYGSDKLERQNIAYRKAIHKYATAYATALINGKVSKPDNGDCWHCLLREVETNKPMGEAMQNTDHLSDHFREKYFVPSLFVRAVECFPICRLSEGTMYQLWYSENDEQISQWQKDILYREAVSSLQKYLLRQFGLG